MLKALGSIVVGLILLLPAVVFSEDPASPLDAAFTVLRTYDWGAQREALLPIDVAVITSHGNDAAREQLEVRLLEVLASDAPRAAKDYVCRQLCVMETVRSVPALGALLSDPALAHMARSALELIPGDEAAAALRAALPQLTGDLRIGVIHSLGRRRDAQAVPSLVDLLRDADERVAAASVAALGDIPAPDAVRAVLALLEEPPPGTRRAAEGAALRIARRELAEGKLQDAAAIYRLFELHEAEPLRYAALQGLWQAEPEQAVLRWTAALSDDQVSWRRCAAQMVRARADDGQIEALCAKLADMPVFGQVELLDALRLHSHPALRAAALASVAAEDPQLRASAIQVLAYSGSAADVPLLAGLAAQAAPTVQEAAEQSLVQLRATGVDQAVLDLVETADTAECVVLIRVLTARETPDAGPKLLQLVQNSAASVRLEAIVALQSFADVSMVETLVPLLAQATEGRERDALERAVWQCCAQITPTEHQAQRVLAALQGATAAERAALLPVLGRLGGPQALSVIEQAMQDQDAAVQDAAIRGLCNWPDATVADQLLELARTGRRESHRTWAIRAYARVAARQGAEKPQEVCAGLREVMGLATRIEDKKLVLSRLTAVRCVESLAWAVSLLDDEQLRSEAIDAAFSIGEGMKQSHPNEARAALEKVASVTQDPELQTYIAKLLWNMQLKEAGKK